MNPKLEMLLEKVLDGQATAEQRQWVEHHVQSDPEARRLFEDMKSFHAMVDASAPAPVQAPPDFRVGIMRRLDTGGGPSGPGRGPSGPGSLTPLSWVAAGAVLLGVAGTVAITDHLRGRISPGMTASAPEELDESQISQLDAVRPTTPASHLTGQRVNPADIQSGSAQGSHGPSAGTRTLEGTIIAFGHGGVRVSGSKAAPGSSQENLSEVGPASGGSRTLGFSGTWTEETLRQAARSRGLPGDADWADWLRVAKKQQIHPGFLLAASASSKFTDAEDAGRRIRNLLDATHGRPETERLRALLDAFDEDSSRLRFWRECLQ